MRYSMKYVLRFLLNLAFIVCAVGQNVLNTAARALGDCIPPDDTGLNGQWKNTKLAGNTKNGMTGFGATIEILCDIGYEMQFENDRSRKAEFVCISMGQNVWYRVTDTGIFGQHWLQLPQCLAATCEEYQPLLSSRVSVEHSTLNGIPMVTLACPTNMELVPLAATQQQCSRNDADRWKWPYPPISVRCVDVTVGIGCQLPGRVESPVRLKVSPSEESYDFMRHAFTRDPSKKRYAPGVKLQFSCEPTYEKQRTLALVGNTELTCQVGGQWTPNDRLPDCQEVMVCGSPEMDKFTYLQLTDEYKQRLAWNHAAAFLPGDSVTFGCVDGYSLDGQAQLVCLQGGAWNAPFPKCFAEHVHDRRFIAMAVLMATLLLTLVAVLTLVINRRILQIRANNARHSRHAQHHREEQLYEPYPIHRKAETSSSSRHRRSLGSNTSSAAANLSMLRHTLSSIHNNGNNSQSALSILDADRLALIAYLEEGAGLPTYDEAVSEANGTGKARECKKAASTSTSPPSTPAIMASGHTNAMLVNTSGHDTGNGTDGGLSHHHNVTFMSTLARRWTNIRMPRLFRERNQTDSDDTHILTATADVDSEADGDGGVAMNASQTSRSGAGQSINGFMLPDPEPDHVHDGNTQSVEEAMESSALDVGPSNDDHDEGDNPNEEDDDADKL